MTPVHSPNGNGAATTAEPVTFRFMPTLIRNITIYSHVDARTLRFFEIICAVKLNWKDAAGLGFLVYEMEGELRAHKRGSRDGRQARGSQEAVKSGYC